MSFLGLSAAFWGLIFGIAAHLLLGLRNEFQRSHHPGCWPQGTAGAVTARQS